MPEENDIKATPDGRACQDGSALPEVPEDTLVEIRARDAIHDEFMRHARVSMQKHRRLLELLAKS